MTKPCYPWFCPECGSAINDRTNHKCLFKMKMRGRRGRHKHPDASRIVLIRLDGEGSVTKTIKNSSRTADLVTQHHAKDPTLFVYRVNVWLK